MIDYMGDTDGCSQISVTFHINGDSSRMMSREKRSRNVNLFIKQAHALKKKQQVFLACQLSDDHVLNALMMGDECRFPTEKKNSYN